MCFAWTFGFVINWSALSVILLSTVVSSITVLFGSMRSYSRGECWSHRFDLSGENAGPSHLRYPHPPAPITWWHDIEEMGRNCSWRFDQARVYSCKDLMIGSMLGSIGLSEPIKVQGGSASTRYTSADCNPNTSKWIAGWLQVLMHSTEAYWFLVERPSSISHSQTMKSGHVPLQCRVVAVIIPYGFRIKAILRKLMKASRWWLDNL